MRTELWIACASVATCVRTRLRVRESAYLPADNRERDDGHASNKHEKCLTFSFLSHWYTGLQGRVTCKN